jgi:hypothetical protein
MLNIKNEISNYFQNLPCAPFVTHYVSKNKSQINFWADALADNTLADHPDLDAKYDSLPPLMQKLAWGVIMHRLTSDDTSFYL